MTDLAGCLAFTLSYEGGFVDNPSDPGGATIWGITLATLRQVRRDPSLTVSRLRGLTRGAAETIYRTRYYLPCRCDQLPAGVALMVGDMAVNAGVETSATLLQRALGLTEDGVIGPVTVAAAERAAARMLIAQLGALEATFYRGLLRFRVFGRGWLARVAARTAAAQRMVQA